MEFGLRMKSLESRAQVAADPDYYLEHLFELSQNKTQANTHMEQEKKLATWLAVTFAAAACVVFSILQLEMPMNIIGAAISATIVAYAIRYKLLPQARVYFDQDLVPQMEPTVTEQEAQAMQDLLKSQLDDTRAQQTIDEIFAIRGLLIGQEYPLSVLSRPIHEIVEGDLSSCEKVHTIYEQTINQNMREHLEGSFASLQQ